MKAKNKILTVAISILTLTSCGQKQDWESKFNLDFEKIDNGFPVGWKISNNGLINTISLDSIEVKSGKYAVVIESKGNMLTDNSLALTLPHDYGGKQITLSGYIKTENVTEGYAGLWMAILPSVAYNDMEQEKLTGTNEWKKFEIRADLYPAITEKIVVGGHLSGKGKMWIDDLKITIDGKDIQNLKPYKPKVLPAEKDKEFDSGSKIVFPELDEQKISDLELLGRIWGFLKYHHPAIAAGKYNWDYELFRILPDYLKINDTNRRDRILLNWIKKYGNVPACKTCTETPDSAF